MFYPFMLLSGARGVLEHLAVPARIQDRKLLEYFRIEEELVQGDT